MSLYTIEYTPEFQLRILNVTPEKLREPILDLGCGREGGLVHHLQKCGKLAVGLDNIGEGGRYIISGDWLDYPLGADCWGSIISHMAFSIHFLHNNARSDGDVESYARRYMEILWALQPGGSFLYAPGVPFMEQLLPKEQFDVSREVVREVVGGQIDTQLLEIFGESVLYACSVTRRQ